jgi:hypothetical protein
MAVSMRKVSHVYAVSSIIYQFISLLTRKGGRNFASVTIGHPNIQHFYFHLGLKRSVCVWVSAQFMETLIRGRESKSVGGERGASIFQCFCHSSTDNHQHELWLTLCNPPPSPLPDILYRSCYILYTNSFASNMLAF